MYLRFVEKKAIFSCLTRTFGAEARNGTLSADRKVGNNSKTIFFQAREILASIRSSDSPDSSVILPHVTISSLNSLNLKISPVSLLIFPIEPT